MPLGFRPAFWPTIITVILLPTLLGLGAWQVQRLGWKRELTERVATQITAQPVPLPRQSLDVAAWEYRRVTVKGELQHNLEMHLLAHDRRGTFGYRVVTPLRRDGGGWVLIDRGFVPMERKDPALREMGQVPGVVDITGVVRRPTPQGWFVPDNQPEKNFWYFAAAGAMAAAAGIDAPAYLIEADASPNPGGLPQGGQTRINFPNNHLAYALIWFGAALALLAIYLLWHRRYRGIGHAGL
jgi:surfeit locus 1 family protein